MDNLVRLRQARRQVVKTQRRIWIVQATFWPVVTLGGIVIAAAVAGLAWRRFKPAPAADYAAPASPEPATQAAPGSFSSGISDTGE